MTLNISPETKVTKLERFDGKDYIQNTGKHYSDGYNGWETAEDLRAYLNKNNYSIAANGVVYDLNIKGFLPSILDTWFNERVEFKNLRKRYEKEGDTVKAEYFDQMQHVTKILLNSFYGVLGQPGFRFFDPDNAVGVTSSGQQLIKFTADMGNQYYKKILGGDVYDIELEDGSIKSYQANSIVNTQRGEVLVKHLTEDDEIIL